MLEPIGKSVEFGVPDGVAEGARSEGGGVATTIARAVCGPALIATAHANAPSVKSAARETLSWPF